MQRIFIAFSLWLTLIGTAIASESAMSFLDNRFRVDETVERITFLVYRKDNSRPVTLVRPDGRKYYAWKHPANVHWIEEPTADIVTIERPMPGPWQAIGKVTPKNNIQLVSKLSLKAQALPERLYQGEKIKFTSHLLSNGEPLIIDSILTHVNLKVVMTRYLEEQEMKDSKAKPIPMVIGEFFDDGVGLDERAGDGVFTVELPITIEPGKYNVRITTGNGVFLRALEQEVFVYPTPFTTRFIQGDDSAPHQLRLRGEAGTIQAGSLATSIALVSPNDSEQVVQGQSGESDTELTSLFTDHNEVGTYHWSGHVYANESMTDRELVFDLPSRSFSVVGAIDLDKAQALQVAAREAKKKAQQEAQIAQHRATVKQRAMIAILVGNTVLILLGALVWWIVRRKRAIRAVTPEMQLKMPG
ncbi:TIGR03503 family protein [Vibrio methylphosphonaticus]|uniref:TIGR03503 family protein n=1 Tax=Vibrio methylphosphonaticus TaxID=2946866 RepID=UPI00202A092B|nr:TIGR03503 family protein [Vibrio methylphosphonaticus]MCL9776051.1 TIGR03503 family protein [Vibrio methylphosphonaticus]